MGLFFLVFIASVTILPEPTKTDIYRGVGGDTFEEYLQNSQNPELSNKFEAMFGAVGDIMLSRNVAGQIQKNNKDGNWPFLNTKEWLATNDFNFGNLESPYSGRDDFNPSGSLIFNAPTWTLPGLINNKFKILNLANNHAFDQGLDGLLYTKKMLNDKGIANIGVGENLEEAWQGQSIISNNINVGFIGASYASVNDGGKESNSNVARIEDITRLKKSIEELRSRADFIVVTMHAGTEYTTKPNDSQIAFAHSAIDAGADMVIGAHSHWVQNFENYNGKYIFYGLGNFVFDQEWSQETKEGLALKITLMKDGNCPTDPRIAMEGGRAACGNNIQGSVMLGANLKQIELVPIIVENYGQPRIATDIEKQKILNKIGATTTVITP